MRARLFMSCAAVTVLLIFSLQGCTTSTGPTDLPDAGGTSLDLGWKDVDGRAVALPDDDFVRGARPDEQSAKPVLLNFWASYCAPCRVELPLLQRLNESGKALIVGVTRDRYESFAEDALDEAGVTYANAMDFDADYMTQLADVIPIQALPTSLPIIDGRAEWVHIGPFKSWADLTSKLDGPTEAS